MTEGQIHGKRVFVRNNGKFEITEFELAGLTVYSVILISLNLSSIARTKSRFPRISFIHLNTAISAQIFQTNFCFPWRFEISIFLRLTVEFAEKYALVGI